jgi:hypothetical protein
MTLDDAGLIASFAVNSVIEYDEYCGGEAEMLVVMNNGETDAICPAVIYPGDRFIQAFQKHMWSLLRDFAHVRDDMESETDYLLEQYFEKIRKLHDESKRQFDGLSAVRKRLEEPSS